MEKFLTNLQKEERKINWTLSWLNSFLINLIWGSFISWMRVVGESQRFFLLHEKILNQLHVYEIHFLRNRFWKTFDWKNIIIIMASFVEKILLNNSTYLRQPAIDFLFCWSKYVSLNGERESIPEFRCFRQIINVFTDHSMLHIFDHQQFISYSVDLNWLLFSFLIACSSLDYNNSFILSHNQNRMVQHIHNIIIIIELRG